MPVRPSSSNTQLTALTFSESSNVEVPPSIFEIYPASTRPVGLLYGSTCATPLARRSFQCSMLLPNVRSQMPELITYLSRAGIVVSAGSLGHVATSKLVTNQRELAGTAVGFDS